MKNEIKHLIKYKRFFGVKELTGNYYKIDLNSNEDSMLSGLHLCMYKDVFLLAEINHNNITFTKLENSVPKKIEYLEIIHFLRPVRKFKTEEQKKIQKKIDLNTATFLLNCKDFRKLI